MLFTNLSISKGKQCEDFEIGWDYLVPFGSRAWGVNSSDSDYDVFTDARNAANIRKYVEDQYETQSSSYFNTGYKFKTKSGKIINIVGVAPDLVIPWVHASRVCDLLGHDEMLKYVMNSKVSRYAICELMRHLFTYSVLNHNLVGAKEYIEKVGKNENGWKRFMELK